MDKVGGKNNVAQSKRENVCSDDSVGEFKK